MTPMKPFGRPTRMIALLGTTALSLYGCASLTPRQDPRVELARGINILQQDQTAQGQAAGFRWIQRAASQNLAIAQDRVGLMYLYGNGAPQDIPRALEWIRKAAERSAPAAQMQLGSLYSGGNCVPRDYVMAYYWLAIAAKPSDSSVHIYNIAQVHEFAQKWARSVERTLTPAQRAAVDQRVASWEPTASVRYSGMVQGGRWVCTQPAHRAS